MKKEIGIEYVVFWLVLAILIIFLAWRTFGHSPSIEALSFLLTAIGAGISWIGLKASFESAFEHKNQTEILIRIQNAIEDLSEKIKS